MRFMVEEDILMVWLDEKDWLELSEATGLVLKPDQQFPSTYIPHRAAIQETIVRLAERLCPAEDQDVVRQASERLRSTSLPFPSITVMSEGYGEQALPGFVHMFNITIPSA